MMYSTRMILLVAFLIGSGCKTVDEKTGVSETLWGEGGAVAYPQAASKMARDFPTSYYLGSKEKTALRPLFPTLVDQVAIHWDTVLLDEWASSSYGVSMGDSHATAQTYGYHIYFKGPRTDWDDRTYLEVLIHEMVHVKQFVEYGSTYSQFGYEYFRQYYLAGEVYENNPLEQEAIQKASREISEVYTRWSNSQN